MIPNLVRTAVLLGLSPTVLAQARWPQFRGPGGLGVAGQTDVPIPFTAKQHTQWKVDVPVGHSSPVVWGDRIFLTGYAGDRLLMLAYSRRTGKELWRRQVQSRGGEVLQHETVCPAMPTACTDGEKVYFYFGGYGVVATSVDGEIVWRRQLPTPRHQFGTANSLVLAGGRLIVVRDGADEAAILGLSTKDGSVAWRIPRPDFIMTYSTPLLWRNAKREELIVASTGRLCSFEPKSGKPLWQVGNTTIFVCPTPVADREAVYCGAWTAHGNTGLAMIDALFGKGHFDKSDITTPAGLFAKLDKDGDGRVTRDELHECQAKYSFDYADKNANGLWEAAEMAPFVHAANTRGRNVCVAVKAGGKGDVTDSHVRWEYRRGLPHVASPLLYRQRLYLVKKGGFVTCLDAKTGKAHFRQKRLPDGGEYFASPIAVGEHVLFVSAAGVCYFVKVGDAFAVRSSLDLDATVHATPAVLADQILIRTAGHLWAFGAK